MKLLELLNSFHLKCVFVCARARAGLCVAVGVCAPCLGHARARACLRTSVEEGGCARAVRPHLQRCSAGRQLHSSLPVSGSIPAVQCRPQDNSKYSEQAHIRSGTGP